MKYIVFNWKCNPKTLLEAKLLFESTAKAAASLKDIEVVICPPPVFISELYKILNTRYNPSTGSGLSRVEPRDKIHIGGQDFFWEQEGPMDCEYVILGHSERKIVFGETEEMVNRKLKAVLNAGLRPVLFFGEMEQIPDDAAKKEIISQLEKLLSEVEKQFLPQILFVYEPAYAVSTQGGQNLTPSELKEKTNFIRSYFVKEYGQDIKLLYGGSVDENNIQSYLKDGEVDGVVIGQASLDSEEVRKIISKL